MDLDLKGARGRDILIWITQLGDDNRVEIAEVTVSTRPGP